MISLVQHGPKQHVVQHASVSDLLAHWSVYVMRVKHSQALLSIDYCCIIFVQP